jgi:hypothetical protein
VLFRSRSWWSSVFVLIPNYRLIRLESASLGDM